MKAVLWLGAAAGIIGAAACSAGNDGSSTDAFGSGSGSASGAGAASGLGGEGGGLSGTGGDGNNGFGNFTAQGGGPGNADAACKAVEQRAEKSRGGKADIIWAIDNSGSMTAEAAQVQANLNFFSQFIAGTGIDVHVVLISEKYTPPLIPGVFSLVNGVCVDPPLGTAGMCPDGDDTNLSGCASGVFPCYMHWRVMVNSNDVLSVIQSSFQGWRTMLRPDASKTFVVVTDDEANPPPTTGEFVTWVNSQPEFQTALWRYSGVVCSAGGGNCANAGLNHIQLIQQTGGVQADMGNPDWTVIFQQLADAVIADSKPVDCEWLIPPPPAGETFDKDQVNVRFTPTSGVAQPVYSVDDTSKCTDQYLGWYYDNVTTPSKVIACPQTCPTLQADQNAKIEVLFGCAREPPPIM